MAETNDLQAHYRSINPKPNSIPLLNGRRFGGRYAFQTNQSYNIPADVWNAVKDDPTKFQEIVQYYVNDHYVYQLPRILELERYYQADNNIHYWLSNKRTNRADNRIASGLPRYITNIQVGYEFGKPLTFGYKNATDDKDTGDAIMDKIDDFNQSNDEPYHEKIMGKNLSNTGRAYELLYVPKDSTNPQVVAIDPNSAFVVWSTDVNPVELFAVRYYAVNVADDTYYLVEVYTDNCIYYFTAGDNPAGGWTLTQKIPHFFKSVPLTEYKLNEERVGSWETKLDEIDGYDQALSEMANSQEDFSNAMMMISGELANKSDKFIQAKSRTGQPIYLDPDFHKTFSPKNEDGKPNQPLMVQKVLDTRANAIYLKPYVYEQPNGSKAFSQTTASYLTKNLNASDWEIYINQILADIHKDTNTPDTTDQNFAANASGVAMAYKLWGSDQEMAMAETLYQRGLRRRLQLLAIYWNLTSDNDVSFDESKPEENLANNVTVSFTPNLPKDDAETMTIVQGLVSSGVESKQTIREKLESVTGVPETQEAQRVQDEQDSDSDQRTSDIATAIQKLHANGDQNNDDGDSGNNDDDQTNNNPGDNNNGGDNNGDSQTGQNADQKAGKPGQPKQQNN